MASLSQIVNVSITKGTRQVSVAGFGIPLIVGSSNRFGDAFRSYTDVADMIADGFLLSDPEYIHAAELMEQDEKPTSFLIGKNTAPVAQISNVTITTVVDNFLYSITLNGVACTYMSDGTATAGEIQAGLIAAINASSQADFLNAATGAGTSIDITSLEAGLGFSIAVGTNLAFTTPTPNHSIVNDLVTIQAALGGDDWYGLAITSKLSSDIRQVAAYIETQTKIFVASSSEAGILTSSTSDIASYLNGKAYVRTALLYSATPSAGPDAAWLGRMLPTGVGAATWKFKTLVGITADNLSQTEINNAQGKKANVFVLIGGVNITTEGVVSSGEYIDVTRFIDWLVATMQSNVYSLLVNNEKVPYTNKGIAVVENAVHQTLQLGIANGGLSDNPAPVVSVPDVLSVPNADKASRTLNNVVFTATLAGAIHKVSIHGFVSV